MGCTLLLRGGGGGTGWDGTGAQVGGFGRLRPFMRDVC